MRKDARNKARFVSSVREEQEEEKQDAKHKATFVEVMIERLNRSARRGRRRQSK